MKVLALVAAMIVAFVVYADSQAPPSHRYAVGTVLVHNGNPVCQVLELLPNSEYRVHSFGMNCESITTDTAIALGRITPMSLR